eukprot:CAMPEP_0173103948 /NCGR_PEP_ID=MMETSP1102-20130122/38798_1 /TAXON_ID=49646 /ORGANISM="Geminigera sp., Strain Caron Lab Isolate" /LENGTH=52 /DNA_ID=CAMNT_0013999069 /DNA_START=161 /DNA_END=316 /DNA_ORIENTATION=+
MPIQPLGSPRHAAAAKRSAAAHYGTQIGVLATVQNRVSDDHGALGSEPKLSR